MSVAVFGLAPLLSLLAAALLGPIKLLLGGLTVLFYLLAGQGSGPEPPSADKVAVVVAPASSISLDAGPVTVPQGPLSIEVEAKGKAMQGVLIPLVFSFATSETDVIIIDSVTPTGPADKGGTLRKAKYGKLTKHDVIDGFTFDPLAQEATSPVFTKGYLAGEGRVETTAWVRPPASGVVEVVVRYYHDDAPGDALAGMLYAPSPDKGIGAVPAGGAATYLPLSAMGPLKPMLLAAMPLVFPGQLDGRADSYVHTVTMTFHLAMVPAPPLPATVPPGVAEGTRIYSTWADAWIGVDGDAPLLIGDEIVSWPHMAPAVVTFLDLSDATKPQRIHLDKLAAAAVEGLVTIEDKDGMYEHGLFATVEPGELLQVFDKGGELGLTVALERFFLGADRLYLTKQ